MIGDEMPTDDEHLANYSLMTILAKDLVEMHNDNDIDLNYWPAGRELVVSYHNGRPGIAKPWNRKKK